VRQSRERVCYGTEAQSADYTRRTMDRFSREVIWQMEVNYAWSSPGPSIAQRNNIDSDRQQCK